MKNYQITQWCHHWIQNQVREGDVCIDATVGNGNDTELLCSLVGAEGKVYGFDIQKQALRAAKKRLEDAGLSERAELFLAGHEEMDRYIEKQLYGKISCIVFNFGYLPGGSHELSTKPQTSICAIEKGLSLLKKEGMMSLCIYSGGDSGFAERDALLAYLKNLDSKNYLVILSSYYNRPNNPPIPVMIVKK